MSTPLTDLPGSLRGASWSDAALRAGTRCRGTFRAVNRNYGVGIRFLRRLP